MNTESTTKPANTWTGTAGPRQAKAFNRAWRSLASEHNSFTEITGVTGQSETRCDLYSPFSQNHREDVAAAQARIGAKWNWTVTRENCAAIIADITAAIPPLKESRPVHDKRTSPEEDSARMEEIRQRDQERQADTQRHQDAVQKELAGLRTEYPWAEPDGRKSSHARAAANLKTHLSSTWPGVVFRVKSSSYSMGDSVSVTWDFGPTQREVQAIANLYQYGHFDGMQDMYESDQSAASHAWAKHFGQSKYVSADGRGYGEHVPANPHRHSDFWMRVARDICALHGVQFQGPDQILGDEGHPVYDSVQTVVHQTLGFTSFPARFEYRGVEWNQEEERDIRHRIRVRFDEIAQPAQAPRPPAQPGADGIQFSENPEKNGVELRFPGKPPGEVLMDLKAHGWRWSRFSKCWYHKDTPAARAYALRIVGPGEPATPEPAGPDPDPAVPPPDPIEPGAPGEPAAVPAPPPTEPVTPPAEPSNILPVQFETMPEWKRRLLAKRPLPLATHNS